MTTDITLAESINTELTDAISASTFAPREINHVLAFAPEVRLESVDATQIYIVPLGSPVVPIARGKWGQPQHRVGVAIAERVSGTDSFVSAKSFAEFVDEFSFWLASLKFDAALTEIDLDERPDRDQLRGKKQLMAELSLQFGSNTF